MNSSSPIEDEHGPGEVDGLRFAILPGKRLLEEHRRRSVAALPFVRVVKGYAVIDGAVPK
jgi:hypothetical protein